MNYDPGIPLGPDIPKESQPEFLTNFGLINNFWGANHVAFGNVITQATQANPCLITSPGHGIVNGDTITPSHMAGTLDNEIILWNTNGNPYVVSNVTTDTFTIPVDTTAQPNYIANSGDFGISSFQYGYHTKLNFPVGVDTPQLDLGGIGAVYPQAVKEISQMFWVNKQMQTLGQQLSNLTVNSTATGNWMTTPWGLTLNWGEVPKSGVINTFNLPKSYPTVGYFVVICGGPGGSNVFKNSIAFATPAPVTQLISVNSKQPCTYFSMGV